MKLAIGIPSSWPTLPTQFVTSLLSLTAPEQLNQLRKLGITETVHIFERSFPLDLCRNRIVRKALDAGADYLLWLDADMTYPPDMISRLLATGLECVGPLYFKNSPPFAPVAAHRRLDDPQMLLPLMDYERGPVAVDVTGMGGLLVQADVLRAVGFPWFRYDIYRKTGEMTVSEDVHFCRRVQEECLDIHVDTRLIAWHIGTQIVAEQHWYDYRGRTVEYITISFADAFAKFAREGFGSEQS